MPIRTSGELLAQPPFQLFDFGRRHFAVRLAAWPLRHTVRLPKIIEVGVDDRDADYLRINRLQTRLLPERPHIVSPGNLNPGIERAIPSDLSARNIGSTGMPPPGRSHI